MSSWKKIKFDDYYIRSDFKNYKDYSQTQLGALIRKYDATTDHLRKLKYEKTRVNDPKITKCIRMAFKTCVEDEYKYPLDVAKRINLTIQELLTPVRQLYEEKKIETAIKNKEVSLDWGNQKVTCGICSSIFSRAVKSRHEMTLKHRKALAELSNDELAPKDSFFDDDEEDADDEAEPSV